MLILPACFFSGLLRASRSFVLSVTPNLHCRYILFKKWRLNEGGTTAGILKYTHTHKKRVLYNGRNLFCEIWLRHKIVSHSKLSADSKQKEFRSKLTGRRRGQIRIEGGPFCVCVCVCVVPVVVNVRPGFVHLKKVKNKHRTTAAPVSTVDRLFWLFSRKKFRRAARHYLHHSYCGFENLEYIFQEKRSKKREKNDRRNPTRTIIRNNKLPGIWDRVLCVWVRKVIKYAIISSTDRRGCNSR